MRGGRVTIAPALSAPRGLNQDTLTTLTNQLAEKRARNVLRTVYADGKNALHDLGISLPPQMKYLEWALGWPAKAISALGSRCSFDGFVIPGEEQDPFDIAGILSDNSADSVFPQAFTSALTHSVAFLTITPGGPGEAPVLLLPMEATHATGIWDRRTGSLSDALTVTRSADGRSGTVVWYGRDHVTTFHLTSDGKVESETQPNLTGRVWVEPLPFKPDLSRPFGHSRISRAVMTLTDAAMRTMARAEGHAEFFASPQRWALGAEPGAFGDKAEKWNAVMSRLLVISRDEDGEVPQLGQFQQMSMQPHFEHLRTLAGLFAGETSVPLSSLGIVQDNPSSAEAIYAAKEDLVIEASAAMRVWGDGLRRAAVTAVMLRDNLTEPPAELRSLRAKWRNPATPSVVSAADATVKKVAALPWLADSEVILEDLGYDDATITRLLADKRRAAGGSRLDAFRAAAAGAPAVAESV